MALPSSGSAADLIATAAATREQAALDAFDTLSRTSSVGRAELALALLQVSEAALATAVQRGTSSPLLTSPRKRDATKQQLDEFLLARGQSGCPATFDDFVALYNDYVDFFDTERSPASKRPPGSRANVANINETDPRVLSMAHNINARMSQARSEGRSTISPMGERSSNRSGPTRMSLVSSSAEAPQIDPDESFSKSETFDRRRRFSVPGEASPSPVPQESPGISPEFFRAGTRKYDYTSDTDRKSARDSYSQRRASGNFSPGGSPMTSVHGGSLFTTHSGRTSSSSPLGMRISGDADALASTPAAAVDAPPPPTIVSVPVEGAAASGGGADGTITDSMFREKGARTSKFRERRLSKDLIPDDEEDEAEGAGDEPLAEALLSVGLSPRSGRDEAGGAGEGGSSEGGATAAVAAQTTLSPRSPASVSLVESGGGAAEATDSAEETQPNSARERTKCRRISLDELVQLEEQEATLGSPNPIDAIARAIDAAETIEVKRGSTLNDPEVAAAAAAASRELRFSREGANVAVPSPSRDGGGAFGAASLPARGPKPSEQPRSAEKADAAILHNRPSVTVSTEMGVGVTSGSAFDPALVGTYSCHGIEPGPGTGTEAKINQDCACLAKSFAGVPGTAFFSVYDGHGKYGHEVSQEAMRTIFHMLEESGDQLLEDPAGTLADAFEACNIHLRLMACEPVLEVNSLESGSCAVVAFMHIRELFVASVGDCRCVLGTHDEKGELAVIQLSTDHKVNLPLEQARIESKGGYVRPGRCDPEDGEFVPARMYEVEGKPWLGPGLCVSRSLGDLNALMCGLIPTPEVFSHVIRAEDKFIILASDGVWEFIDNEEAVRIVQVFYNKGLPALDACRYLIARAAVCWRRFEGDYRDDITAVVVYLDILLGELTGEALVPVLEGAEAEGGAASPEQ